MISRFLFKMLMQKCEAKMLEWDPQRWFLNCFGHFWTICLNKWSCFGWSGFWWLWLLHIAPVCLIIDIKIYKYTTKQQRRNYNSSTKTIFQSVHILIWQLFTCTWAQGVLFGTSAAEFFTYFTSKLFKTMNLSLLKSLHSIIVCVSGLQEKKKSIIPCRRASHEHSPMRRFCTQRSRVCFCLMLPGLLFTQTRERHTESSCCTAFGPCCL